MRRHILVLTHAWAAVTLKLLSLNLDPPATNEHPRTSSKFDKIDPSNCTAIEQTISVSLFLATYRRLNDPVFIYDSRPVSFYAALQFLSLTLEQCCDSDDNLHCVAKRRIQKTRQRLAELQRELLRGRP